MRMVPDARQWILISWLIWLIVWVAWGVTAKRTVKRQSAGSRLVHTVIVAVAIWILMSADGRRGPLGVRIIPLTAATQAVAIACNILGLSLTIWARAHLGRNWSANVTVKTEHELIRSGPYAAVRHPIYSGPSLAALGLATLNGDLLSLAATALLLLGWRIKSRIEERFMMEQFGADYVNYMHRVKALIPYIW